MLKDDDRVILYRLIEKNGLKNVLDAASNALDNCSLSADDTLQNHFFDEAAEQFTKLRETLKSLEAAGVEYDFEFSTTELKWEKTEVGFATKIGVFQFNICRTINGYAPVMALIPIERFKNATLATESARRISVATLKKALATIED